MSNLKAFVFFICALALSSAQSETRTRIVGGLVAQNGQFSYHVSLSTFFDGLFCSGSILNENWIITSGHCVQGRRAASILVGTGSGRSSSRIEKIVIHNSQNIALIKLTQPLPFSATLNKIDLPTENKNIPNTPVNISGLGSSYRRGPTSRVLKYLTTVIEDLEICKEDYSRLRSYPAVTDDHLCTMTRAGQGLCDGDSGDPVVAENQLVGVAMYGYPCGQGYPDISANVWKYVDWIKSNINYY